MPGAGPYVAYWANMLYYDLYRPIVVFIPKEHLVDVWSDFAPNLFIFPDTGNPNAQNFPRNILDEINGDYFRLADFAVMNKNMNL
jgi:hypothetical protein